MDTIVALQSILTYQINETNCNYIKSNIEKQNVSEGGKLKRKFLLRRVEENYNKIDEPINKLADNRYIWRSANV